MRIRLAVPPDISPEEKAGALDAALEAVTRGTEPLIRAGKVPTANAAIDAGAVRWRPEPPGDEHFDLASTVLGRGWGDCDDLAPWHAASLRVTGADPYAQAIVMPSGPGRWHAVVQRSNGEIDDPSLRAGMKPINGLEDYFGPFWNMMHPGRLGLAVSPMARGVWPPYAARVDIPDMVNPFAWSGVHMGQTPPDAVRGACQGALLGAMQGYTGRDDLAVVGAVHDLICGAPPEYVQDALDQIGFLPGLAAALPIASGVLDMFGGGGGKGGAPAPAGGGGGGIPGGFPGGGGGAPYGQQGPAMQAPGPIIIRF